jgi:hypothetical protein
MMLSNPRRRRTSCGLQTGVALFLILASRVFSWTVILIPVQTARRWSIPTSQHPHPPPPLPHTTHNAKTGTILYSSQGDSQNDPDAILIADTATGSPTLFTTTSEELATIESVFDQCAKANGDEELRSILLAILPTLSPSLLVKLRQQASGNNNNNNCANTKVQAVSKHVNAILAQQLDLAKATLSELLNAGEIRKLDALIGKASREGQLDAAFFNVLTLNLKDATVTSRAAQRDQENDETETASKQDDGPPATTTTAAVAGSGSRYQILTHIYTRCQEEVEKTIAPSAALLNKLLRTTEAAIRKNLYLHYLTVQSSTITAPDGSTVNIGARPVLVPLDHFAFAIDGAVLQIRNVETAGGVDRESAAMMVEACRQVAREARIVIGESYGIASTELRQWEDALEPVFRPTSPSSPYIKGQY